jgi:hypothetical protein
MDRLARLVSMSLFFGAVAWGIVACRTTVSTTLDGMDGDGTIMGYPVKPCSSISSPPSKNAVHPIVPDPRLTPGSLCKQPSEFRYPERIPYCERDVDGQTKAFLRTQYANVLSFTFSDFSLETYKTDHMIPLCAGGSNDTDNLWPQHLEVQRITDPLEPRICAFMEQGLMLQAEAVKLIIEAKTRPEKARGLCEELDRKWSLAGKK